MRGFLRGAVVCAWLGCGCSSSGGDSSATNTPEQGQGGSATGGGGSSGAAAGGSAATSGGTGGTATAGSGGNPAGGSAGGVNAGTGGKPTAGASGNGAGGSAGASGGSGGKPAMEWPWPSYDDARASPKSTRLLVVLLDFSDSDIATLIPEPEPAWSKLIFGTEQAQGNHYWYETSAGQFQLLPAKESSGVTDNGVARVKLGSTRPTEGQFVVEQQTWIPEALDQLATDVDFDAFDTNGDGTLQNNELSVLFILNLPYARINGAGAQANILLSHPIAGSGVMLDKFARSQVDYSSIGTPMHELGHHILDLDHGPQPSEHDLMGLGAYNEDPVIATLHDPNSHYATRPAGLGGLNKIAAGFVAPTRITETTRGLKLYAPETGKMFNVLELPVQDGFLYLENRTAWGYDRSIPFCAGAAGGLFAVDASQYLSPLNLPAIESRPPLASFDSPDEIFCDYYALAGHNAPVSFGGWQLENVSEAGPVMTLDLVKTDAPVSIEHYKFRFWIINPNREGYRMWHWQEAPPNGSTTIDFATFPSGDDATGYFTITLEAYYSTGEVRSVNKDVVWTSDSSYAFTSLLTTITNPGSHLDDAIINISLDTSAPYTDTATISATVGDFQTSFKLINIPAP
jgi:M6 family metalloprotease-like protein